MTAPKIERLQYGITREWHQGTVNYCILRTPEILDRARVEHWELVLKVTTGLFKPDEPVRILYDLSLRGRVIPLYIATVHQALADRTGYQAFVLPDELMHRVLLAMQKSRQQNPTIQASIEERLFTAEADAVNWLLNVN